jgi:hypothetical protein
VDRRDILKASVVAPVAVLIERAPAEPADDAPQWVVEKYLELPLHPGDEITGLANYHDELFATTRWGELFRISMRGF